MVRKKDGNIQIIRKAGRPEYAVVPWKDYQAWDDSHMQPSPPDGGPAS